MVDKELCPEGEPRHGVLPGGSCGSKHSSISMQQVSTRGLLGPCPWSSTFGHAISSLEGQNAE